MTEEEFRAYQRNSDAAVNAAAVFFVVVAAAIGAGALWLIWQWVSG